MGHIFYDLFFPLSLSLLVWLCAFSLGMFVFKKIALVNNINLFSVGISTLLGYGILGYLVVGWTFIAPLNSVVVLILIILSLLIGQKNIQSLFIKMKFSVVKSRNLVIQDKLYFLLITLFFLFYITSALIPPYQTDALAYHLPEAKSIAQSGVMGLSNIGNLYGTSPILLESLYSLLYVLSGSVLVNLVHYQLLLAGLLVVYYFTREQFGKLSAQLSIALIFSLYEVFVNATSAYIDAAMASYQIASIIMVMMWSKSKDQNILVGGGILYGLALSIKYLSLYALLLILPFIVYTSFKNNEKIKSVIKDIFSFLIPMFLFSGFWYIKNLILFINPFYPFIFAHPGFSDAQIQMSNVAIKEFIPRTLKNYLSFPFILFSSKYYLTTLLAFIFLPFGLFLTSKNKLFKYILIFVLGYFTIWFFLISHQKRFVMIGLLFLMVCLGHILSMFFLRYKDFFNNKFTKTILIIIVIFSVSLIVTSKNGYFFKVKKAEISYIIGMTGKGQFYNDRGLGDIYYLSQFINHNYSNTKFLTIWSDDTNSFLDNGNIFVSPYAYFNVRNNFDPESLKQFLHDNGVDFVVDYTQTAQDKIMKEWYNTNNSSANDYRDKVVVKLIKISNVMPKVGSIIYSDHERLIYAVK